ncbi:MAG: hypothetical protein M0R51_14740 [Clostridia bacterium]|nr:hypothetical protein [Clostridia bacterium]
MNESNKCIEVSLPPCEKLDWGKRYYALISDSLSTKIVYSTGESVSECKRVALEERAGFGNMSPRAWITLRNKINRCDLDVRVQHNSQSNSYYVIKICDAKTHIYGKAFGYYRIRYLCNDTYDSDTIRFDRILPEDSKGGKFGGTNARR